VKQILYLILLAAATPLSAPCGFLLGVSYSEWLGFPANSGAQIATDSSGAIYFLTNTLQSNIALSTVTKLTADGKTLFWQNKLSFVASAMTVDPSGGVYIIPAKQQSDTSGFVAKLSTTGSGLAWQTSVGFLPQSPPALATDSQGRVYFAAQSMVNNFITRTATVVRLNAAGSALEYTAQIMGTPTSIAIDPSGAAIIAGSAVNTRGVTTGFLAKVAPDGAAGFYSVFPAGLSETVAVDANGNIVLFGLGIVQRLDSSGTLTLTTTVEGAATSYALDAAGNAYIAMVSNRLYPVKNSLATCRFDRSTTPLAYAELLTVIAPDGSLLQSTYIPGGDALGSPLLAIGPNSTVVIAAVAGPSFAPTQSGPFAAGTTGSMFLSSLSPNTTAQTYSLVCAASAAGLEIGAVAPGQLIALFGNGLGPQTGVQTQATLQTPYPTRAANVQVTFDGTPSPLLWVQDTQINLVAPWSLTPNKNTQVCVSYNNFITNCLLLPVVQSTPAVFMSDGRYAAALNQDGSYNSAANPAPPGSVVTVFATGLGPVAPLPTDGALTPLPSPNNVLAFEAEAIYTVGIPFGVEVDVPFTVEYAGPAPYQVAGVSQINFRVAPYASYGAIYLHLGSTFSSGFCVHIAGQ
jgi:uncharacterized protein (TIGR03437 family)